MRPCWIALGALLFEPPLSFAPAATIRTLLGGGPLTLIYAGDRMWPSVSHGQRLVLRSTGTDDLAPGRVVVADCEGVAELLRIVRAGEGGILLQGDADPGRPITVGHDRVLATVDLPDRRVGSLRRVMRRIGLEIHEALRHGPGPAEEGGETVRRKYETQAVHYRPGLEREFPREIHARLSRFVRPAGRILVAGSGVGKESFSLAQAGWRVEGIDFAPGMVRIAREEAARRGLEVPFHLEDLRTYQREPASLDGVLFTYDVYSFIPDPGDRIELLGRMRRWLRPDGALFLSARMISGLYERCILTLVRLAGSNQAERLWGACHSRWIDGGGTVQRSFLRKFTPGRIRREAAAAGLRVGSWEAGHFVLTARQPETSRT